MVAAPLPHRSAADSVAPNAVAGAKATALAAALRLPEAIFNQTH